MEIKEVMSPDEVFSFVMLTIGVPVIFIGVPVFVLTGGPQKFALKPLMARFKGIQVHDVPQPGDVSFRYHTYRGFLLWFVQDEHNVIASPDDARLLLARLLRFNLTWGMLSYGLLFVPFLAIGNYLAQKRSIEKQLLDHAYGGPAHRP